MGNEQSYPKSAQGFLMSRQLSVLEVVAGCEAKNRYYIRNLSSDQVNAAMQNADKLPSRSNQHGKSAGHDYYGQERSECFERICCKQNRSLTLEISEADANASPFMTVSKPFSCVGCCCLQTQTSMQVGGNKVAHARIKNPVCCPGTCCKLAVLGSDPSNSIQFETGRNNCCNVNMCCRCCGGNFVIPVVRKNGNAVVAEIVHPQMTCTQVCGRQNELFVSWKDDSLTDAEKNVIINMLWCTELEYFSYEQSNN